METNRNLSWLYVTKYLPERNINIIKETLLKSGVAIFYRIIRRYIDKPRQHYSYRYVKPYPSTRFRKQTTNVEKTNIGTNYQKTLAEYARRLEETKEEFENLKITLHDIKQDRKILK